MKTMGEKIIKIVKLNKHNFRDKIVAVWQDQKENEIYDFEFEDEDVEKQFEDLCKCFTVIEEK